MAATRPLGAGAVDVGAVHLGAIHPGVHVGAVHGGLGLVGISHVAVLQVGRPRRNPSSTSTAASSKSGASTTSSSSASSTVQSDIANGNNLLAIGQYLVDNGYSKAAAAGVASCVDGESGATPSRSVPAAAA